MSTALLGLTLSALPATQRESAINVPPVRLASCLQLKVSEAGVALHRAFPIPSGASNSYTISASDTPFKCTDSQLYTLLCDLYSFVVRPNRTGIFKSTNRARTADLCVNLLRKCCRQPLVLQKNRYEGALGHL